MSLADSLQRLAFDDQAKPTAIEVHSAWSEQTKKISPYDNATIEGLDNARDIVLKYAENLAAKERALCERVEAMRVLTYDTSKPMDEALAMNYLGLPRDAVVDQDEILKAWETQMRGTIPRRGGDDPFSQERKLNRARDIALERLRLPEYQEALRARLAEAARLEGELHAKAARLEAERVEAERLSSNPEPDTILDTDARRIKRARLGEIERRQAEREANLAISIEREEVETAAILDAVANNRLSSDQKERLHARLLADRRLPAERSIHSPNATRMHRRTVDNKKGVELLMEMERVFAERFEEKEGGRLYPKDLYDIFVKSTTLSEFEEGYFTHHSKMRFLAQWKNAKCTTYRHKRCYVGVAEKVD